MSRAGRLAPLLIAVAVGLATVRLFGPDLALRPTETDDVLWISRGALTNPEWLDWLFARPHFVGYRPLPALSFTLDWLVGGGFSPAVYHGTDLLLHLGAVAVMVPLFRALFPAAPAWAGLVAAVLLAAHPATTQVVPWFSRRSYLLAVLAASGALLLQLRGRWAWAAGALAAGLLSNETAFVAAPIVLLAARSWRGRVATAVASVGVLALRSAIVGKVGYSTYTWTWARALGVLGEAVHGVWGPDAAPSLATTTGLFVVTPLVSWHLGRGATTPSGRLLALWTLGAAALVAITATWFHRLAYPFAVPAVLLVAAGLSTGRLARLPSVAVAAWILWQSPLWRGLPAGDIQFRIRMDAALAAVEARLSEVPEPAEVFFVTPWFRRADANPYWNGGGRWAAHVSPYWATFVLRGRDVVVRELATVRSREGRKGRKPGVRGDTLVFGAGTDLYLWPARTDDRKKLTAPLEVALPEKRREASYLLFVDPIPGGLVGVAKGG